jgi:hypothetical protein
LRAAHRQAGRFRRKIGDHFATTRVGSLAQDRPDLLRAKASVVDGQDGAVHEAGRVAGQVGDGGGSAVNRTSTIMDVFALGAGLVIWKYP